MMKMATFFQGLLVALVITGSIGGKCIEAQVRHVAGGDRGWDPYSDIASWASERVFRVGDEIWFTYSAAQGLLAELQSKEAYESCDLSNPIKMYTDGLHIVPLEREGIRYFVSSEPESCKNGLKLHVEVLPNTTVANPTSTSTSTGSKVEADAPSTPSGSARYGGHYFLTMIAAMLCVAMGLAH